MDIRESLEQLLDGAIAASVADGSLAMDQAPEAALERPRDEANGDWASTVAMRCAKAAKKNPREIAQIIVDHIPANDMIAEVSIAGPGFINIRLTDAVLQNVVRLVRETQEDFGKGDVPQGERKINLEYVSANPTGPLHVGHGRWGALGDAMARVMRNAGYDAYSYLAEDGENVNYPTGLVVNSGDENSQWAKDLVGVTQTEEFAKRFDEIFQGAYMLF